MTCIYFLPWSLKTTQDWPGMIFVYVLNISQSFDTGVYFKPYYWFFKWKINDKERRNRDEGHFFRRNYMYIIWFFFKNCFHWHIYWRNLIQHWYSVTSIHSCWHYKNKFQKLYTFSLTWKAMIEQFKDSTNGPIEIIVVAIHYKHLKIGQI